MKPELILHIGAPKTGTTAFQNILLENRILLQEMGVLYPLPYYGNNHSRNFFCYTPDFYHISSSYYYQECQPFLRDQISEWRNTVFDEATLKAEGSHDRVILSSEWLFGRDALDVSGMKEIKGRFSDYQVKILCCLREQSAWLRSHYAELIKSGVSRDVHHPFYHNMDNFLILKFLSDELDYERRLDEFALVFGRENVKAIWVEDWADILVPLFQHIGVDPTELSWSKDGFVSNRRMSWAGIASLRVTNRLPVGRHILGRLVKKIDVRVGNTLPRKLLNSIDPMKKRTAEIIKSRYQLSNEAVRKKYSHDE